MTKDRIVIFKVKNDAYRIFFWRIMPLKNDCNGILRECLMLVALIVLWRRDLSSAATVLRYLWHLQPQIFRFSLLRRFIFTGCVHSNVKYMYMSFHIHVNVLCFLWNCVKSLYTLLNPYVFCGFLEIK